MFFFLRYFCFLPSKIITWSPCLLLASRWPHLTTTEDYSRRTCLRVVQRSDTHVPKKVDRAGWQWHELSSLFSFARNLHPHIVVFTSFLVTSGTCSIIPHCNVFKTEFATWLSQDRHGNFAAAKEQFFWMSSRSPNQVSTASEFIFAPPEKLASEFLWQHHQPLYIHPQELNTEKDQVFAAQSGGSAALWDITQSEQSFTSVYRALAANRLELVWQHLLNFLWLQEELKLGVLKLFCSADKIMLQFLNYLYL